MKSYFNDLFQYNARCNQELSTIFAEDGTLKDGRSHRLFSHILDAHHIWNHRMMMKPSEYGVWELQSPLGMRDIDLQNLDDTTYILERLDLDKVISYQTSKGQKLQNKVSSLLFHIINHSTYHRGQIAIDFRERGMEPLVTDYIFWKRKDM